MATLHFFTGMRPPQITGPQNLSTSWESFDTQAHLRKTLKYNFKLFPHVEFPLDCAKHANIQFVEEVLNFDICLGAVH